MLPDFPKLKSKFVQFLKKYYELKINQDAILSQIKRVRHFEGNKYSISNDISVSSEYKEMSDIVKVDRNELINKGFEAFVECIESLSENFIRMQTQDMFKKMEQVAQESGNVINAQGKDITLENFFQLIEKTEIDFMENGEPDFPTLIIHPNYIKKLKDLDEEFKNNLDIQKKYREIINKKRDEWYDRESNRKLVD